MTATFLCMGMAVPLLILILYSCKTSACEPVQLKRQGACLSLQCGELTSAPAL